MMIKKGILDILACPKCKGKLEYDKKNHSLSCKKCRLKFEILEGDIPNMLLEDAKKF